jgi:hypothetical protein
VLCAGVLAALFAQWRDRLPDPVASHFRLNGEADGYLAPATWLMTGLAVLIGLGAMFSVMLLLGGRDGQRRAGIAAGIGVPALLTAIFVQNLLANLDLARGGDARLPGWWIAVALATGGSLAALAWWLAGPDPRPAPPEPAAGLELAQHEAVAWNRTAGSRITAWMAGTLLLVGLLLLFFGEWGIALVLVGCALTVGAFARVQVTVDRRGLRVSPVGIPYPRKVIGLEQMESAGSRRVSAMAEFGGWGYRVRSGASGVVLRSGPALSVRLRGGREFVVTAEDPETAAALLNGLIARRLREQDEQRDGGE